MKFIYGFMLIFLMSCGDFELPRGDRGNNGSDCSIIDTEEGALVRCSDGTEAPLYDGEDGSQGPKGDQGEEGPSGADFVPSAPDFDAFWALPNGGYLELLLTDDNRVVLYGTQRIYSVNFDGGLALHPTISAGPHYIRNGMINGEYNANYSSTTNDLERDGSTSNISGVRKTVYNLRVQEDGRLRINLITYSTSGLIIEVNRTILSE